MEAALKILGEQGLAGALLVLALGAIVYLNKKREDVADARLADTRELLTIVADVNQNLRAMKEAVSGLSTSLASLTTTIQTMQSDSRSSLTQTQEARARIERMIEANSEAIRTIKETVNDTARDVDRLAGGAGR